MELAQCSAKEPAAEVSKGHVPPPLWIRLLFSFQNITLCTYKKSLFQ